MRAASGGAWKDIEVMEALTPAMVRTVGWVLREDTKCVVVAAHISDESVGGDMCIPKSAIRRRQVLTERKRKPK